MYRLGICGDCEALRLFVRWNSIFQQSEKLFSYFFSIILRMSLNWLHLLVGERHKKVNSELDLRDWKKSKHRIVKARQEEDWRSPPFIKLSGKHPTSKIFRVFLSVSEDNLCNRQEWVKWQERERSERKLRSLIPKRISQSGNGLQFAGRYQKTVKGTENKTKNFRWLLVLDEGGNSRR